MRTSGGFADRHAQARPKRSGNVQKIIFLLRDFTQDSPVAAGVGFELENRMIDAKSFIELLPDPFREDFCSTYRLIFHLDVAGKGDAGGTYIPGVEVVNSLNLWDTFQIGFNCFKLKVRWGGVHQDTTRRLQNHPAIFQYEKDNKKGQERIKPDPRFVQQNHTADEDPHGGQEIPYHVEERPAQIQILLRPPVKQPGGKAISKDSDTGKPDNHVC